MQNADFWHDKWASGEIGFHQDDFHPFLKKYWKKTGLKRRSTVFVPLCGKTKDMLYLRECSHDVIGVELSAQAAKDFFAENNMKSMTLPKGDFDCHIGNGLSIYTGDFFKITEQQLKHVRAVYDRAALIALPEKLRSKYAEHLKDILPAGTLIFLVTIEYEGGKIDGPPFSVSEDEITSLFGDWCDITKVTTLGPEDFRGVEAHETLYQMTMK